jgi:ABC-type molybdenum transport system ATPase subunit/photorepair protein PhrA
LSKLRKKHRLVDRIVGQRNSVAGKKRSTVVFGKFAQIGYLVGFWGQASGSNSARARRYLKELGSDHLQEQGFGMLSQGE